MTAEIAGAFLRRDPAGSGPVYNAFNDPYALLAIQEIYDTYGDIVDIKPKTLRKFGATANADSGVKTTIATFGSVGTPNVNETFSTTNDIDALVSSSGSDTGPALVEGHTIDADGNLDFTVQSVTLQGQTPATLTTPLGRMTRIKRGLGTFASPVSDFVGDIYGYASSGVTVTAGVPQTNAAVKCRIVAGKNQTEKAATSLSYQDYWILTQTSASVSRGNSSTVTADVDIEFRETGGVFLPVGLELAARAGGSQAVPVTFKPYVVIPKNSDVRMVAVSNTDNSAVSGYMAGMLAKVRPNT